MSKRIVMIEWEDSFGVGSNWEEIKLPMEATKMVCTSVGWLAHDGDEVKVIIPHWHDADQDKGAVLSGCGDMTIPSSAVLSITDLEMRS